MGPEADFLGMITNLSCALSTGIVSVRPRGRIIESISALCRSALQKNLLRPSVAKSLLGKLIFASMGMYKRLGRAPARPLIQRACIDASPWSLSYTLKRALEYILLLIDYNLDRRIDLFPCRRPAIVIASDAQADPGRPPSAGAIAVLPCGSAFAAFCELPSDLLETWGFRGQDIAEGRNPIAICEAAAVLLALWQWRAILADFDVLWYVDNTVALSSIVKGMGKERSISRVAEAVGILSYRIGCNIWFEYVQSKDNWADGVSRVGFADPLVLELKAKCAPLECSSQWWTRDLKNIWVSPL